MNHVLIRCDSSSTIGTGHVMRDIVLAKQFKNSDVFFASIELVGNINYKITEAGYKLITLKTNSTHELISIIREQFISLLVIDNYSIDYEFEKRIKDETGIKIFVLDDTYEKHCCDILLNHNVSANPKKYNGLIPKTCELRCGSNYTLIRDEFYNLENKNRFDLRKVDKLTAIVIIGGTDHKNINIAVLETLLEFKNIAIKVVTTDANKNIEELRDFVDSVTNITLFVNSSNISVLMNESDFAITTPSVTINEVLFLKLPFIAIKTAENQNDMYTYLIRNNYLALEKFDREELRISIKKLIGR